MGVGRGNAGISFLCGVSSSRFFSRSASRRRIARFSRTFRAASGDPNPPQNGGGNWETEPPPWATLNSYLLPHLSWRRTEVGVGREETPDFFPLRRFLVPIFFAKRESPQDSAVLTDIQSSFWRPLPPPNGGGNGSTEPPPWATLNSYLLPHLSWRRTEVGVGRGSAGFSFAAFPRPDFFREARGAARQRGSHGHSEQLLDTLTLPKNWKGIGEACHLARPRCS